MDTDRTKKSVERLAMRPAELAVALGVSRAQAYLMLARGEIRSVRSGKAILVPREAVQDYLSGAR